MKVIDMLKEQLERYKQYVADTKDPVMKAAWQQMVDTNQRAINKYYEVRS